MRELARVVKPGGPIAMLEFGVPAATLGATGWRLQARRGLPALARFASPAWREVARFLGPSIEEFHAREPAFRTVERERHPRRSGCIIRASAQAS